MTNGTFVTFAGHIAQDPELRFTPGGHAVCNLVVLVNKRVRDGNGGWKDGDTPTRHEVQLWRQDAENAAESFVSGSRVMVAGTLDTQSWTDKETNETRYRTLVVDAEVGASTKHATVKIQKTTRATAQEGQQARQSATQAPANDPWGTAPGADEPPF